MKGGRPGRSGGHNRIALEAHVLRGTFDPTRHTARIPAGPAWQPTPAQLDALGEAGRAFVARVQTAAPLDTLDGELALEGAQAVDRLAELRARRVRASAKARRELDRLELAWQRALSACLLALRVRTRPAAAAPVSKWGTGL